MKIPSSSINQKEIINNIRTRLLIYTLRELNPISRLDNKTKINSQSSREIEKSMICISSLRRILLVLLLVTLSMEYSYIRILLLVKQKSNLQYQKYLTRLRRKRFFFLRKRLIEIRQLNQLFINQIVILLLIHVLLLLKILLNQSLKMNSIRILRTYASTLKMSKKFVDSLNKNYVLFIFTFQIIQKDFSILSSKECNSILR